MKWIVECNNPNDYMGWLRCATKRTREQARILIRIYREGEKGIPKLKDNVYRIRKVV